MALGDEEQLMGTERVSVEFSSKVTAGKSDSIVLSIDCKDDILCILVDGDVIAVKVSLTIVTCDVWQLQVVQVG